VLRDARSRAKKLRRAASIGAFSGWTILIFAGITAVSAILGDVAAMVMGLALGTLGWNELRGVAMLKRFDPRGARVMGYNQIGLGLLIVIYAAWSLRSAADNPLLSAQGGSTGDAQADAMISEITGVVTYGLYGSMMVAGLIGPGLTAWYYFSREKIVRAFVANTPPWALEAMRTAG